jgi:hypothetical protein
MHVRFWCSDKPRERLLADAFCAGVRLHGDTTDIRRLGEEVTFDCDAAIMVGVKSRELWNAHTRAGVIPIYQDKGYSRHSRADDVRGWEYWRVAVGAHQPTSKFRPDYPGDRLSEMGWEFRPWREPTPYHGGAIVIAGSSEKYHNFYDLKHPTEWASKLVKAIEYENKREIVYRPKPSWKNATPITGSRFSGPDEKIADVIRYAHCLVTHGSNACFEAMLMGVPSIILGDAVMKPISSTDLAELESPRLASDSEREAVLRFLAYNQWTQAEMLDGKAWPTIRRQIFE